MLVRIVGVDRRSFVAGLDVAEQLIHEEFTVCDPRALRSAASSLEACATEAAEFGLAAGFRLEAAKIDAQREVAYVALLDALELNDAPRVEVAS